MRLMQERVDQIWAEVRQKISKTGKKRKRTLSKFRKSSKKSIAKDNHWKMKTQRQFDIKTNNVNLKIIKKSLKNH